MLDLRIATLAGTLITMIDRQLAAHPNIDPFTRQDIARLRVLVANTKTQAERQELPLENMKRTEEALQYYISKYEIPDALPEPEQTERNDWTCDNCGQDLDRYCPCPSIFA